MEIFKCMSCAETLAATTTLNVGYKKYLSAYLYTFRNLLKRAGEVAAHKMAPHKFGHGHAMHLLIFVWVGCMPFILKNLRCLSDQ